MKLSLVNAPLWVSSHSSMSLRPKHVGVSGNEARCWCF